MPRGGHVFAPTEHSHPDVTTHAASFSTHEKLISGGRVPISTMPILAGRREGLWCAPVSTRPTPGQHVLASLDLPRDAIGGNDMTATLTRDVVDEAAQRTSSLSERGGKYLTFVLADEHYGVEILKVREIMGLMNITTVPQMPSYMKGVINLRGNVIPVIDLRLKFDLSEAEHTEQTCIIVVDVGRQIGIIVDTVSEVLDVPAASIEPPPSMGGAVDTSFILGMGKVGDAVKILLDIDMVLSSDELKTVAVATGEEPSPPTAEAS